MIVIGALTDPGSVSPAAVTKVSTYSYVPDSGFVGAAVADIRGVGAVVGAGVLLVLPSAAGLLVVSPLAVTNVIAY